MNISIVPTLRLKFTKHFSEDGIQQLIREAKEYRGQYKSYTINNLSGGIEEIIFVFQSSRELEAFKSTAAKGLGKVKPALVLSYNEQSGDLQKRIGQKLRFFAFFFGGETKSMSFNERGVGCSITLIFWSNWMCKAYAKCMKLL